MTTLRFFLPVFRGIALIAVCLGALSACAGVQSEPSPPPDTSPIARDYWPTNGWRTADPAAVGLDPALVASLEAEITGKLPFLNSLLIVKDGYLVHEAYFNGHDAGRLHPVNSVTKSVVSAVYGIALADGVIPNLDVTLGDALPAYFRDRANRDRARITLRDLLQMRSGLAFDEGQLEQDVAAAVVDGGVEAGIAFFGEKDLADYALQTGVAYPSGEAWSYSSGDSNLLSAAFSALAGRSISDYAAERLFPALGITDWDWISDANGVTVGSIGLQLAPRDMAKIGYLYLNRGLWAGEQVAPAEWVWASTLPQSDGVFTGNGLTMPIDWYGMHWWNWRPELFAGQRAIAAQGYGGQMVILLPGLDTIVVTTADTFVPPTVAEEQMALIYELVKAQIVPSATPFVAVDAYWALPEADPVPAYALYTADANGRGQAIAFDDPDYSLWGPALSPDGTQVAFSRALQSWVAPGHNPTELHVADVNGDNLRRLTSNGRSNYLPAWSPDGTMIAFVSGHIGRDSHEIFVVQADGTGEMRLTDNDVQEYGVAWSPDGKKLAYGTKRDGTWQIYTMNPDGSEQQGLPIPAVGHSPTWSPDGRRIAFVSEQAGTADILVMDADGKNQRPLVDGEAWDYLPVWSPDGSQIAFVSTRDGSAAIFTTPAEGGAENRISGRDLIAEVPSWRPDGRGLVFSGLTAPKQGGLRMIGDHR